jgi:hypothetical protein
MVDGVISYTEATIIPTIASGYRGTIDVTYTSRRSVASILVDQNNNPITTLGSFLSQPSDLDVVRIIDELVSPQIGGIA